MAKQNLIMPFAVNKKFHCDPSRFVILRKAIESELASLEWELNSPLLSAHINPMDYPIVPEITFLSDRIKSKIKTYLLLKFAFTIVDRKYVEFDTEKEHKLAKEWLQEVLNILMAEIISENHRIRQEDLESIEIFIDFNEKHKFIAENVGKRMYEQQTKGHSNGGSKAINLTVIENLSLQNQQAANQFNKYVTGVKKQTKRSKNSNEVLWQKPHTNKSQSHSKGKKAKDKQKPTDDTKDTIKRVKEVDNDDELHDRGTKERKICESNNDLDEVDKSDKNLSEKTSANNLLVKETRDSETNISEKQIVQTVEQTGNLAFQCRFKYNAPFKLIN